MSRPQIQVSFQGGGARFIEMLPIAHALADAHAEGRIRITRVAGSSAGSICAALVATSADFERVRAFMNASAPAYLQQIGGPFGGSKNAWLARWRQGLALKQAMQGTALISGAILTRFLTDLFQSAAPTGPRRLEEVNARPDGIRLSVTGSDISISRGVLFKEGNLVDIVASSCAIPFVFRSFTDCSVTPYVDGGVCENLPVEDLLGRQESDGVVFAVSVVDQDGKNLYRPTSALDFCMQLISASMNHNVERAKRLVGSANVIEVSTDLKTFDFAGAIARLADDRSYADRHQEVFQRLLSYANLQSSIRAVSPVSLSGRVSASKIMKSLYEVFEHSRVRRNWVFKKSSLVVRADCLYPTTSTVMVADRIMKSALIEAQDDGPVCFYSATVLDDEGSIVPTCWSCYNETRRTPLQIHVIPVEKSSDTGAKHVEVLIFFENSEQFVAKGDIIKVETFFLRENQMLSLVKQGSDFIRTSNPHQFPIGIVDIVLAYPSVIGSVTASLDTNRGVGRAHPLSPDVIKAEYAAAVSLDYSFIGLRTTDLLPGEAVCGLFTKLRDP